MQEEFKSLKLKAASLHTAAEGSGKINKKGLKRSMNKQMMESVQAKFPNHKLIALSENGMSVGLLDTSGNLFSYTFNAEDNGEVMESRIAPCAARIVLSAGEVELNADVADVVDYTVAAAKTESGEIKQLSEELNAAKEQIRAMQEAESKRRLSACKAAAKATLEAFNANRKEKLAEDAIKAVKENIEAGVYANSCDKDGAWLGEKMVRDAVLAVCGEAVMEADRKAAENRKSAFAWNNAGGGNNSEDGIEGMLSRIGRA